MDECYNLNAAADALELELQDAQSVAASKQLVTMLNNNNHNIKVAEYCKPQCWRLTKLVENCEAEEIIARFQGIIGLKDLPPYTHAPMSTSSERRRFLRQGITLIGVNATAFKEVINAIVSVHSGFSRHLPEDTLLPWTPSVFQQHDSIDVSNRYFVPRHIIDPQTITPFSSNVDPHGVLRKLQGSDLVHTVDNQVEYYERIKNTEGAKRYLEIKPSQFHVGDIVEVQASFVVVPLKDQKFKMLTTMRALTLLNSAFSLDAASKRVERSLLQTRTQASLKRKVGYADEDDEISSIRKGVANLQMAVTTESLVIRD